MKHTPGPWIAGWAGEPDTQGKDEAGPIHILAVGRGGIARCSPIPGAHASTWPIVRSNARLIAAAPTLYKALNDSMQYLDETIGPCEAGCECLLHDLHAALNEADGGNRPI